VLSNVGREDLDDLGMVVSGVSGEALEGVDAAQANIEFAAAQLVDGPSEALGDLARPVEAVGKAGEDSADDGDHPGKCRQDRCTGAAHFLGPVFALQVAGSQSLRGPLEDEDEGEGQQHQAGQNEEDSPREPQRGPSHGRSPAHAATISRLPVGIGSNNKTSFLLSTREGVPEDLRALVPGARTSPAA
jgi:hypothetical protein